MILSTQMNEPLLHHYHIADDVLAFSSCRAGGVGEGEYSSFNINPYSGDTAEHVANNRMLLAKQLGIETSHVLMARQTHGTTARYIGAEFLQLSSATQQEILDGVDALITQESNVCIGVSTADCIPILLYDSQHHAIAAIHAGWRGTAQHIAKSVVRDMQVLCETQAENLKAVIGVGISLKHFEVGMEVYEAFQNADFPMEKVAALFPVFASSENEESYISVMEKAHLSEGKPMQKWHIDLKLCNRLDLEDAGVKRENIYVSDICTYEKNAEYFSARRQGILSGRIYNGILLR